MNIKNITVLAILIATAAMISFIESLLPLFIMLPGFKLGLANVVTLWVLYTFGLRQAMMVCVCRVLLAALLFGKMLGPAFFMAILGAVGATFAMAIALKYLPLSLIGVSVIGATIHNLVQLLVAMYYVGSSEVLIFWPYLVIFAVITGYISGFLIHRLQKNLKSLYQYKDFSSY